MKLAYVVLSATLLAPLVSRASFDELEARAKAYRESGQLARDEAARAEKARVAAMPGENQHYMNNVRLFARRYGGFAGKPVLRYEDRGYLVEVEFHTRAGMDCKAHYADMTCIDTETLEEYTYFPHTMGDWGPGWRVSR